MPVIGDYLLDTNIAIAIQVGSLDIRRHVGTARTLLPLIVVGELYYGAYNSTLIPKNIQALTDLIRTSGVVDCTLATTEVYGSIKADLRRAGTLIPENDIWIAAIAVEHDMTLITRDKHFDVIARLKHVAW